MNRRRILLCAATLFGIAVAPGQNVQNNSSPAPADDRLAALRTLPINGGAITSVERTDVPTLTLPNGHVQPNLPPRTIVRLMLNPAKGSNINVEMWLPDPAKWNGCLLGLGNGGAAGHINPATLSTPAAGGYAAVTTDMGTAPNADSGLGNPEVWKDFGFRATHLMTVAAKQLVRAYYGRAQDYAYLSGGSTGGQQALQEAQRYPEDYDGILATIAAHCRTPLHAYFLWNDQILSKCSFTKSQQDAVVAAGNEYMAPREGPAVAGKFVSDPRCTPKDIEAVIALAMEKDPTRTPTRCANSSTDRATPSRASGSSTGFRSGRPSTVRMAICTFFKWVFGAKKNLAAINFGADNEMQSSFKFYLIPGMAHGGGPGINHFPDLLVALRNWREKGVVPDRLDGKRIVDKKAEAEMPIYPIPSKPSGTPLPLVTSRSPDRVEASNASRTGSCPPPRPND